MQWTLTLFLLPWQMIDWRHLLQCHSEHCPMPDNVFNMCKHLPCLQKVSGYWSCHVCFKTENVRNENNLAPSYLSDDLWRPPDTEARHWLHSTFFSRPMHSAVYHRWQSISCCICSSVEQSSIACHHCSIFLSAFHSHLKSHLLSYPNFLLFFSFFTCSVPVQWLNFGHCNRYNYYILHLSRSHSQNVRNWSTRLSVRHVQLLSMTVTLCCCQMVCIQTELMSIIQDCFLFYCSCLVDITRICRLFTEWILPV